ncbi:helix-turn-helix domain-containing protein [Traorella massiliensis]|uniref:helix-turn-helix domain-containing protein n=1 Tax=Traorella massiliensis TaxID=1903263 RepID=UPI002355AAB2|nr:helix-turn-helix transcriptional regulator [Traorella massiliensis]
MNQMKIGSFFKELRKEKALTQEQLAEIFGVSRRTVSRWETGSNLPDLDILIEMADYFKVDLRELLDGERKGDKMDKEMEEVVLKVADYSNEEKKKLTRRMHVLFIAGLLAAVVYSLLLFTDNADNFFGSVCLGFTSGMMVVGVIMTSKYAVKIQAFKTRVLQRQKH